MDILSFIISRMNYIMYILLILLGMYGIFIKRNYMKKIIGLNILQTAIILFFISTGTKKDATIPILDHNSTGAAHDPVSAMGYMNPLPHVLMLTAIVVAVATLGVALAMGIKIYQEYGTIEEDRVLSQFNKMLD